MKAPTLDPGYWIQENIFSSSECESILAGIGQSHIRAGLRNLMRNPTVAAIAEDRRLIELGKKITGKTLVPFKATLFNKTGKANWLVAWHQDTALPVKAFPHAEGWGPMSVKEGITFVHAPTSALSKILAIRIHLDASTKENGPLRVIPGSHHCRIQDDREMERWIENRGQTELLVGKGGVIAMSPLTIHASSKCVRDAPRRVLHIEYSPDLKIESDVELAIA